MTVDSGLVSEFSEFVKKGLPFSVRNDGCALNQSKQEGHGKRNAGMGNRSVSPLLHNASSYGVNSTNSFLSHSKQSPFRSFYRVRHEQIG